ncbi:MAG: DNA-3-methyladenine glycosylase 2 family protein [Rhodothermales bacterium]|nr:DNA-3-methyladenine glycosylase 2 family protein [Rhodothermales bacterium]
MVGTYSGPDGDGEQLTPAGMIDAAHELANRDPALRSILERHGLPPFWARTEGFPTLLHIILEQQVSLASARAAYDRLAAALGGDVTPATFLLLDDESLRRFGFSRQKTTYGRHLARAIQAGALDLAGLARLDDEEVRRRLVALPGIGPWTADIYLLMALRRPDIWPRGDLALAVAMQRIWKLPARPSHAAQRDRSAVWSPWRSVAARLLWHNYLGGGG